MTHEARIKYESVSPVSGWDVLSICNCPDVTVFLELLGANGVASLSASAQPLVTE